ncbi:MAG TPA: hypothetical protein VKZ46_02560, partial [Pedomonas sp.]|nr:hypothetical protein [Pedomonas sp.]
FLERAFAMRNFCRILWLAPLMQGDFKSPCNPLFVFRAVRVMTGRPFVFFHKYRAVHPERT